MNANLINFADLPRPAQNNIVDRANLRMVALLAAIVAVLGLVTGGRADALYATPAPSIGETVMTPLNGLRVGTTFAPRQQGKVTVYVGRGYRGRTVSVETSSDNRGWCVPVSRALGDVGRSLSNDSAWRVLAYRGSRCEAGTGFTVKPHAARSGVNGGPVYVRSIRIVRP